MENLLRNEADHLPNAVGTPSERRDTTVETITRQLYEDRRLAHETKQADATVQATMGLAKLHGLLVDRHEDINRSYDNMTKAEIEAEIARLTRAKLERHLVEVKAKPGRPTFKLVRT